MDSNNRLGFGMEALEGPVQRRAEVWNRLEQRAKELPMWFEEVGWATERTPRDLHFAEHSSGLRNRFENSPTRRVSPDKARTRESGRRGFQQILRVQSLGANGARWGHPRAQRVSDRSREDIPPWRRSHLHKSLERHTEKSGFRIDPNCPRLDIVRTGRLLVGAVFELALVSDASRRNVANTFSGLSISLRGEYLDLAILA